MATLVCTLVLSKDKGLTITIRNDDDSITQTLTMDGKAVTITVQGKRETSTYTQTDEAIKIACKDFEIDASDSIKCTAKKTLDLKTGSGDMTVDSGGKLTQKAKKDVEVSGKNIKLDAKTAAKVSGNQVEINAKSTLKLAGKSSAEMSGATLKLEAKAKLEAKSSGMAILQGSMTQIKGSMIKAG